MLFRRFDKHGLALFSLLGLLLFHGLDLSLVFQLVVSSEAFTLSHGTMLVAQHEVEVVLIQVDIVSHFL